MRTAADAAARLRQRATEFRTEAVIEPSPIHATARRRAGATLTALAVAIDREGRTDTAAADALMHLARDYRQTHLADLRDPDFEDYQIVCGHLADTLTEIGGKLRRGAASQPVSGHPRRGRLRISRPSLRTEWRSPPCPPPPVRRVQLKPRRPRP